MSMADTTAISWCDRTWSPWEGCTKVSPACDHCYAARRNTWLRRGENWGTGAPRRLTTDWNKPRRWNAEAARAGRRISVFPSICDPFDNEVPDEMFERFFSLIAATPNITWLLLTKRIGNARRILDNAAMVISEGSFAWSVDGAPMLPNVWLGATVVTQAEAERDVPKLLDTPARVRFVSIEPMLGPVDLRNLRLAPRALPEGIKAVNDATVIDAMRGERITNLGIAYAAPRLDWVICGGESGPGARPMHPDWARSLRDQCAAAGVPFHFKQWGDFLPASADQDDPQVANVPASRLYWSDGAKWDRFDGQRGGVDLVARVGTARSGRLLDGVEHNAFPA